MRVVFSCGKRANRDEDSLRMMVLLCFALTPRVVVADDEVFAEGVVEDIVTGRSVVHTLYFLGRRIGYGG